MLIRRSGGGVGGQLRTALLLSLLCLSVLCLLLFVSASSSSSSSALPLPSSSSSSLLPTASSTAVSQSAASSSPPTSSPESSTSSPVVSPSSSSNYSCVNTTSGNVTTARCTRCNTTVSYSNSSGSFVTNVSCSSVTYLCTLSAGNVSSCSVYNSSYVAPAVVLTSAEILQAAECPMFNSNELQLVQDWTVASICAGGSVDNEYTCDPDTSLDQNCKASTRQQGNNTDSIYSTNPPHWWRCTYTPDVFNASCVPNNETDCEVPGTSQSGLQVVSQACYGDDTQCAPGRYITQINFLDSSGGPQWSGQSFPPYSQFQTHPIAVVVAGSAMVNASLFYPAVDVLQLLQIENSYNLSFLSLSASTRVVVETIGGIISNSRTRLNPSCGYVVPFFTLILDLSQGYIDSAKWQDDCSTCSEDAFVTSDDGACNCGIPISSCIGFSPLATGATVLTSSSGYANNSVSCDLQIYLGYSGTDSNGNTLTSSSRTIANFREFSLGSIYNSAVNFASNVPSLDNFNNCLVPGSTPGTCDEYAKS